MNIQANIPLRRAAYIPALRYHWLTPLYDPVLRWAFPEQRLKREIVQALQTVGAVLDLGSGTGTLALMIHAAHPSFRVVGLDVDASVLVIASRKAPQIGECHPAFVQGSASVLPMDDASFDCVVTSLVFHHLVTEVKQRAFRECFRVLRPGGQLIFADFAAPRSLYARGVSVLTRRFEEVGDNISGRIPLMIEEAGFADLQAKAHIGSIMGTMTVMHALRPQTAHIGSTGLPGTPTVIGTFRIRPKRAFKTCMVETGQAAIPVISRT